MDTASLDDFMTLNDQITALIRAQVPTGLELGSSGDQAAGTLEKINAAVARRVSRDHAARARAARRPCRRGVARIGRALAAPARLRPPRGHG